MTIPIDPAADARPRVLLVDDTPDNLHLLAAVLADDYDVLVATDGRSALERVRNEPQLDLVLLDLYMPGLDGYEVCRRLRDETPARTLPVIFVTADDDERAQTEGFAHGAVDFIVRPFSVPVVRARVRTHVELKRRSERLERLALLDGLTGIANRRSFDERYLHEWRRAVRNGRPLGLVLFDLDHFKRYNDTCGHPAGDDCLRRVARLGLDTIRRPGDLLARYGGEEFALLLPETDAAGTHGLAECLRVRVAACFACAVSPDCDARGAPGPLTLSAGCASRVPGRDDDPAGLIAEADRRLYAAKALGRNRVVADDTGCTPATAGGGT